MHGPFAELQNPSPSHFIVVLLLGHQRLGQPGKGELLWPVDLQGSVQGNTKELLTKLGVLIEVGAVSLTIKCQTEPD